MPSRKPPNAVSPAATAGTRGASSSTGNGISHTNQATGSSPVPKCAATAVARPAANDPNRRLRPDAIEHTPHRSTGQCLERGVRQREPAAVVQLHQPV